MEKNNQNYLKNHVVLIIGQLMSIEFDSVEFLFITILVLDFVQTRGRHTNHFPIKPTLIEMFSNLDPNKITVTHTITINTEIGWCVTIRRQDWTNWWGEW